MNVIMYCCAECDSVSAHSTFLNIHTEDLIDCVSCGGSLSCYPIVDPFIPEDYIEELSAIRDKLNQVFPTNVTKKLEEEKKDLIDSVVELKEWAEEQASEASGYKSDTRPLVYIKAKVRIEVLSEMIEHCEAVLEVS